MTQHVAILLAALIQPSDPLQIDALAKSQSSVVIGSSQVAIPVSRAAASESVIAALPMIQFSFPNRREFTTIGVTDALMPDTIRSFSHFVRCFRTDKEKKIAPRLIEIALAAAQHFHVDTVEVISGYRARPYGAPHSKHFLGQALDIRLVGVSSSRLANWLWSSFQGVGIGYYPRQNFVHVDTRDADLRWVDNSPRGESGNANYFSRNGRVPPAPARGSQPPQPSPALALAARPTS
jgi:uncharacterized protein YcbK (DUF882 family)